jgi:queuine/archaeosine tRNA-ribosyltransferase
VGRAIVQTQLTQKPASRSRSSWIAGVTSRWFFECGEKGTRNVRLSRRILFDVIPGRSKALRRRRAIATMTEMIGTLIRARAVDDPTLSDEILSAYAGTIHN